MKCYPSEVIKVAEAEIGYKEKATNSQLDSKTANVGYKNWNKYARDIDEKYPDFYNGKKNGYDWCDVFVDWCFITAYGMDNAQKLLCQPNKSLGAGCEYSYKYYKAKGQVGDAPKLGAQIFFGDLDHTGIVVDFDNSNVWTVEGNTGSGVNEVCKKKYARSSSWIYGYGYPAFDKEDEKPIEKPIPTPDPNGEHWSGQYPSLPSRGYYLTGDGYERYTNKKQDIKYIQEFLNWAINAGLKIDGCYGSATTKAVETFQKAAGIEADGSYGKETLAAAKSVKKAEPTPAPTPTNDVIKATEDAQGYDKALDRTYRVNSKNGLNIRSGAGVDKRIMIAVPNNQELRCYGYYTDRDGLRWLYISTDYNGKKYIGFVSSVWIRQ